MLNGQEDEFVPNYLLFFLFLVYLVMSNLFTYMMRILKNSIPAININIIVILNQYIVEIFNVSINIMVCNKLDFSFLKFVTIDWLWFYYILKKTPLLLTIRWFLEYSGCYSNVGLCGEQNSLFNVLLVGQHHVPPHQLHQWDLHRNWSLQDLGNNQGMFGF